MESLAAPQRPVRVSFRIGLRWPRVGISVTERALLQWMGVFQQRVLRVLKTRFGKYSALKHRCTCVLAMLTDLVLTDRSGHLAADRSGGGNSQLTYRQYAYERQSSKPDYPGGFEIGRAIPVGDAVSLSLRAGGRQSLRP
jgi:hypothetical protein